MGTLKKGSLGGFSGKVGNVVGASWKGIEYIRSLPSKVNDPKTKRQVKQRSGFSVTMDFQRTITPFLRIGFQSHTEGRMTAFNAAMSYNMKFAVKGEQEGVALDYPNVRVSRGGLSAASDTHAEVVAGELQVSWAAVLQGNARSDDIAMLLAHNPAKGESAYDLNAAKRAGTRAGLPLPASWKGDAIETYLAFKTADATMVSESVYTGRYLVY